MSRGRREVKIAVTVDADVHAKVVKAVEAKGTSVSAWITAAAYRALLVRDGLAAAAEWETEHGALTRAELDAARGPDRAQESSPQTESVRLTAARGLAVRLQARV